MKLLCTFALCAFIVSGINEAAYAAGTDAGGYEVIANAFGFGIDIPGCADASKNIREIGIDELNIDAREMTTGLDVEYRLYGPGAAHWGQAKFTSAVTLGGSKELQAWWQEAAKGRNIRKNITVTLFKSDKSPGRSYVLFDCFPTQWKGAVDEEHGEEIETLWVSFSSISFIADHDPAAGNSAKAEATTSDKFAQVRGFQVAIVHADGREVDSAWESVSGGALMIELTETTIGSDKFQTTSPGHKSVNSVVLRGAMTDKRAALCTWINETVSGKPWKRTVVVTELTASGASKSGSGKTFTYLDCFPTRYVFPRLSVYNDTGNMMEEIELRMNPPIRVERHPHGTLEIEDAPNASRGRHRIVLNDRDHERSLLIRTGDSRDPSALIVIKGGSGDELRQWYQDSLDGVAKGRTIIIYPDKAQPSRRYILYDCFPTQWSSVNFDTSSTVQTETLTVKIGRIEFKT